MARTLRVRLSVLASALLIAPVSAQDLAFYPGDYTSATIIGNSLPPTWRPFSADAPWNRPISAAALTHADNDLIMRTIASQASNVRLSASYIPPIWVVNADNMPFHEAVSPYPFDIWDTNYDGHTEAGVPIDESMWAENTPDGHIIVVDPFRKTSWEMSRYTGMTDGILNCTTFNVWDLTGPGVGDTREGNRWGARGGRGSGFPVIAGLVRAEELQRGEIPHALVFTFPTNRDDWFVYPAARTDGDYIGSEYPMSGMRLQLDPNLTDADFDAWGLTREAKVVARALQKYGMFDGDQGGAMAIQIQLLDRDPASHAAKLEKMFPGFARAIQKIPVSAFRIVEEGHAPMQGGGSTTVVTPLILPQGGILTAGSEVTIQSASKGAVIRYTLDGSTPTESSPIYSRPFSLSSKATVLARAFDSGKNPSPVARAEFWVGAVALRPLPPTLVASY